jgi:hypothetical protein
MQCLLLTTNFAAIDFTFETATSSDRACLDMFNFNRDVDKDFAQFNQIIKDYFDVDI